MIQFSSVQSLSHVQFFAAPWTVARQASLSIPSSQSLPKFMSIQSVIPSNHLTLCCPLLLPTSIFPSIRVFSKESALHIRWPKQRSFSISPCNEYSALISLRTEWFDLPAVHRTLRILLQHHNLKASVLRHSASFMAPLSHPYMTTAYPMHCVQATDGATHQSRKNTILSSQPEFSTNTLSVLNSCQATNTVPMIWWVPQK